MIFKIKALNIDIILLFINMIIILKYMKNVKDNNIKKKSFHKQWIIPLFLW